MFNVQDPQDLTTKPKSHDPQDLEKNYKLMNTNFMKITHSPENVILSMTCEHWMSLMWRFSKGTLLVLQLYFEVKLTHFHKPKTIILHKCAFIFFYHILLTTLL